MDLLSGEAGLNSDQYDHDHVVHYDVDVDDDYHDDVVDQHVVVADAEDHDHVVEVDHHDEDADQDSHDHVVFDDAEDHDEDVDDEGDGDDNNHGMMTMLRGFTW